MLLPSFVCITDRQWIKLRLNRKIPVPSFVHITGSQRTESGLTGEKPVLLSCVSGKAPPHPGKCVKRGKFFFFNENTALRNLFDLNRLLRLSAFLHAA